MYVSSSGATINFTEGPFKKTREDLSILLSELQDIRSQLADGVTTFKFSGHGGGGRWNPGSETARLQEEITELETKLQRAIQSLGDGSAEPTHHLLQEIKKELAENRSGRRPDLDHFEEVASVYEYLFLPRHEERATRLMDIEEGLRADESTESELNRRGAKL